MEPYNEELAPAPFPLYNTGAICHFNSLLQALVGQTAFIHAVLKNKDYMLKTGTGEAVLAFVKSFTEDGIARAKAAPEAASHSNRILVALMKDLAVRRPKFRFGSSQESASEGLVMLLDMIEPPPDESEAEAVMTTAAEPGGVVQPTSVDSPITRLFLHRYQCELHCARCKNVVSTMTDLSVQFNLFYFDAFRTPPKTPEEFSEYVRRHVTLHEDYRCAQCKKELETCSCDHCRDRRALAAPEGAGAPKVAECKCAHCECKGPGYRLYRLLMIPEIAVCLFNLYRHPRPRRYVPARLTFPAKDGAVLSFKQTAMIEQFGALDGGHYIARALRANQKVFLFNDSVAPSSSAFVATPNTYIVMYHFKELTLEPALEA